MACTFSVALSQIAGTKVAEPGILSQNGIASVLQFHNRGMVYGFVPVRQLSICMFDIQSDRQL